MSARKRAFDTLVAALRGSGISDPPWDELLAISNHTLLTPALFQALDESGQIAGLPEDVRTYLRFMQDRNAERNTRLREQLREATAALNDAGIVPLLLKGAIPLFLNPPESLPSRMTSDLDVAVAATDLPRAEARLKEIGYGPVPGVRGAARPQDVGLLELRPERPTKGPDPELVDRGGIWAQIPPPLSRARHWILHDLVKEGDYLRGRLDLRHLYDLVELDRHERMNWAALRLSLPDRASRNAFDLQMLALHDLFGVDTPPEGLHRLTIRFHHWRRLVPVRHPAAGVPLRIAGNLFWGARKLHRLPELMREDPAEAVRKAFRETVSSRARAKL